MIVKIYTLAILFSVFILASSTILKTGQSYSYDMDGNIVTNNSIKDDGYYKKGKPRNYSRIYNGKIVKDNTTGLEWQNAYSDRKGWKDAKNYCSSLDLDGKGWRLPSVKELATLIDSGEKRPSISPTYFDTSHYNNDAPWFHWTRTSDHASSDTAWIIVFNHGLIQREDIQGADSFARCVRGGFSNAYHELTRDSAKKTVLDRTTHLEWQDNTPPNNIHTLLDAIEYCEDLSLGNRSDWRLPNYNELLSIADYTKNNPAIYATFKNTILGGYITSTTDVSEPNRVWFIDFRNGEANPAGKIQNSSNIAIRCVRDAAVPAPAPTIDYSFLPIITTFLLD